MLLLNELKNFIIKKIKNIKLKFKSLISSIKVVFCFIRFYEHNDEDQNLNIVDRSIKIKHFFKECLADTIDTYISIKSYKSLHLLIKISKFKFFGFPFRVIIKIWFLFRKFSLSYTWFRFYIVQQVLLWFCLFIWFVGYTYDFHDDRFLYEYFLILVVMNYNIYTLGVYMFKITVMKPFDYVRGVSTMLILNWVFFWFSLPIWHFIMDHMDKGMTYKSIPILRKYESKLDEIPMFEADLQSRISIKKKKEIAREKIKNIKIKKKELREKRRLQRIAEKKTILGALKHFFLDMLWNVASKIAYKKVINDAKFMMRATDVPAEMKPIATEHISRLLLNLKRFTYSDIIKKKRTIDCFKNYLTIAFRRLKKFFKVKSLHEKYFSKVMFAQSKMQMENSIRMREMFKVNELEIENNELTQKLNEYRKNGLLTRQDLKDLKEMKKQVFGNDTERDVLLKSNFISRIERNRKYKEFYKQEIMDKKIDKMINEFDHKKFKDDDYSFLKENNNSYRNKSIYQIQRENDRIKRENDQKDYEQDQIRQMTKFIDEYNEEKKLKKLDAVDDVKEKEKLKQLDAFVKELNDLTNEWKTDINENKKIVKLDPIPGFEEVKKVKTKPSRPIASASKLNKAQIRKREQQEQNQRKSLRDLDYEAENRRISQSDDFENEILNADFYTLQRRFADQKKKKNIQ